MSPALLKIEQLNLTSPTRTIIQSLDLELCAGETLAVMGPSGTGKSMLSRAIAGILPEQISMTGEIFFSGEEVGGKTLLQRASEHRPGVIFQDALQALNPLASIEAQLALALTSRRTRLNGGDRAQVIALLDQLGFSDPEHILQLYPSQLSGGQRQRICIAIALISSTNVLIADEPTSALDPITEKEILHLFRSSVKQRGLAGVLITHDLRSALECDKLLVIADGKMVAQGTPEDVLDSNLHPFCQQLKQLRKSH
ncbi:ATP-binding cassette domain-containing protein [Vibrio sp. WXL210]|uniref:ATP-binding cassette domain-containing protein n=1 Tax=Vibrio sp. WXL210 TaxID=3450709 RepID=UPI003EC60AF4